MPQCVTCILAFVLINRHETVFDSVRVAVLDYTDVSNTVAKSLGVDELGKCSKDDIVARTVDRDAMDVSVGRTIMGWSPMWIEQAGKGASGNLDALP